MSDMTKLLSLVPETPEWEAERERLIMDLINEAPKEKRQELVAFQATLDAVRETMSPAEFMQLLVNKMTENLKLLEEQLQELNIALSK